MLETLVTLARIFGDDIPLASMNRLCSTVLPDVSNMH